MQTDVRRLELSALLGEALGERGRDAFWFRRRDAWGGLNADELWALGCEATIIRAAREVMTFQALRDVLLNPGQ